jgi:ABC-type glycerol-3-phosphate transport system permease component
MTGQRNIKDIFVGTLWRVVLAAVLVVSLYPFIFMVITSFKNTHQFYHYFWTPRLPLHFENYTNALHDLATYMVNSIIVTVFSVGGIVISSVITGFLLARYSFPGRQVIYYAIITLMMLPATLMLIPSFMWVKYLGLLDTHAVMILPFIAGGQVLGVFLLRAFFSQLDQDLFEAAQMDGAGTLRQLWHIAIPLAKPIIGVVAIMSAISVWNNFLWPLVTTSSDEVMVITVGILRYNARIVGQYGSMYAGFTISAIPLGILFALCTKMFMKGITSGALKG